MRPVLLRRSALGDVVLVGAVAKALGEVGFVTDARYVPLVERMIGVVRAMAWEDPHWRRSPGPLVDLQGNLRSRIAAPWARRIRKQGLKRRLRLWTSWVGSRPSVTALYGAACGVEPAPPPWFRIPERTRDTLALLPGAAWPLKRPRAEALVAAGRAWPGPVVVLGGPGEEVEVASVADHVPGAEALVERGFDRTLDWLARTRVALGGDSGAMHLAGACGARVVALFGPTHPDDGFFVHEGEALGRELPCRPCSLHRVRRCRAGHHGCMDLPVDRVLEAVDRCAG